MPIHVICCQGWQGISDGGNGLGCLPVAPCRVIHSGRRGVHHAAGHGPDTPHFLDAPEALTKAVAEFDLTGNPQALSRALAAARPRDGLTLWHLLQRTPERERAQVFDRFATLVKLPSNVTREGIRSGDPKSMDAAWDALDLGGTSWWREWKRTVVRGGRLPCNVLELLRSID